MSNPIQDSIQRTRATLREMARRATIWRKRKREAEERAASKLELLIDDICAETGLRLTEANLPTIMLYVQGYLSDMKEKQEDWDGESFL